MIFLLDSNACIEYMRARNPTFMRRFNGCDPAHIRLCPIVVAELFFSAFSSGQVTVNVGIVRAFSGSYGTLPFDDAAAEVCGEIRARLSRAGTPIGKYDFQIAAIALVQGATLVTHNVTEFARVPNLLLEDWQV